MGEKRMIYRHEDGWMVVDYRTGIRRMFRHRDEAEHYLRFRLPIEAAHREMDRMMEQRGPRRSAVVTRTPKIDPITFGKVRKHTMV